MFLDRAWNLDGDVGGRSFAQHSKSCTTEASRCRPSYGPVTNAQKIDGMEAPSIIARLGAVHFIALLSTNTTCRRDGDDQHDDQHVRGKSS